MLSEKRKLGQSKDGVAFITSLLAKSTRSAMNKTVGETSESVTRTHFLNPHLLFENLPFESFSTTPASAVSRPGRFFRIRFYSPVIDAVLLEICPNSLWCVECAVYSVQGLHLFIFDAMTQNFLKYCCHKMYLFIWMRLIT